MTPDASWYLYASDGQQGPYAADELIRWYREGSITDEWYVWRDGFTEWRRLGDVAELVLHERPAHLTATVSPAIVNARPDLSEQVVMSSMPSRTSRRTSLSIMILLSLLLLVAGGYTFRHFSNTDERTTFTTPVAQTNSTVPSKVEEVPIDVIPQAAQPESTTSSSIVKILHSNETVTAVFSEDEKIVTVVNHVRLETTTISASWIYPNVLGHKSAELADSVVTLESLTRDSNDVIIAYYKKVIADNGYKVTGTFTRPDGSAFVSASKEMHPFQLAIYRYADTPVIWVSISNKPNQASLSAGIY